MQTLAIDAAQSAARSRAETDALIIEQVAKQLDAALASEEVTHQQLSFLPSAEYWPLIDYAVRLWASPHGFTVERDEHQATGRRIVVDRFQRHGHVLVTVHVPEAHHPYRVTKLTVDELSKESA